MKNYLLTATLLFFTLTGFAQNRSIQFEKDNWKGILAKAKKENRLVFVDAYTTWCGPCKWMAKNVFTNDTVADFYNASFVNAKIDMEKGEGVDLAKKYGIRAYPTMLFIDADGNVVHRVCGSSNPQAFISQGKDALDPAKQLIGFTNTFNAGPVDPAFASSYLGKLAAACQSYDAEIQKYFHTQSDQQKLSRGNWNIIYDYADEPSSPAFQYFENHKNEYVSAYGIDSVEQKINQVYRQRFNRVREQDELDVLKARLQRVSTREASKIILMADVNFYSNTGKWNKFADAAVKYMSQYQDLAPSDINSISWSFYEHVDDREQLNLAAGWMDKVCRETNEYAFLDTYAALLYKTGRKTEAKSAAEKAIETAKKSGEDHQETIELLKKINKL